MMSDHVGFDVLNELLDDRLEPAQRERVQQHLARCEPCAATWSALRDVQTRSRLLPTALPEPEGLWEDIQHSIRRPRTATPLRPAWLLAAAAVVLIAITSGVTAWLMRSADSARTATARPAADAVAGLPAAFIAAEEGYAADVAELRALFEGARPSLAPETVRVVEQSLATIDDALVEALSALLADPGNVELVGLIGATYRQKIELLRRAAELPHSL